MAVIIGIFAVVVVMIVGIIGIWAAAIRSKRTQMLPVRRGPRRARLLRVRPLQLGGGAVPDLPGR